MVNEPNPGFPPNHTLSPEAMDFMQQCWRRDPRGRPTASKLLQHPFIRKHATHDSGGTAETQASDAANVGTSAGTDATTTTPVAAGPDKPSVPLPTRDANAVEDTPATS